MARREDIGPRPQTHGSLVGGGLKELINEISIGSVDLDTVKSSSLGLLGGIDVVGNGSLDLLYSEGMGDLGFDILGFRRLDSTRHLDRRGRDCALGGRVEAGMCLSSHMPKLAKDLSVLGVDSFVDLLPSFDVVVSVNGSGVSPSVTFFTDTGSFCDDETSRSTLFVVEGLEVIWSSGNGVHVIVRWGSSTIATM